jgi:hypothetical protein
MCDLQHIETNEVACLTYLKPLWHCCVQYWISCISRSCYVLFKRLCTPCVCWLFCYIVQILWHDANLFFRVISFAWRFMWELPVCKFCCCTAWLPRLGTVQDTPSAMQVYRWPGTLCHLPMVSKALRLCADGQQMPPSVNVRVWTGLQLSQTSNVHECASSGAGRVTRLHWHLSARVYEAKLQSAFPDVSHR